MMKISSDYLRRHGSVFRHERKLGRATSSGTASTNNVKQYRNKIRSIWEDSWGSFTARAVTMTCVPRLAWCPAWHRAAMGLWRVRVAIAA